MRIHQRSKRGRRTRIRQKMNRIWVVELGGNQLRRAFTVPHLVPELYNIERVPTPDSMEAILDFALEGLYPGNRIVWAVAGPVTNHRVVQVLPNVPGKPRDVDLVELTQGRVRSFSVAVINDMEAAVTGMAYLLGEQGEQPFWGITWSSGIGGRYWNGKKIVSDAEIGHIPLSFSPIAEDCGCGKKGHVEAIIGGNAIREETKKVLAEMCVKIPEGTDPCQLLDKAHQNREPWAVKSYEQIAVGMGRLLAIINQANPAKRAYFKGRFALNALVLPGIREIVLREMQERVVSPPWTLEAIEFSPDPENDALIGAVLTPKEFYSVT